MKRVKIAGAIGLQLAMIVSIGSFVKWPYMNYVAIGAGIAFFFMIVFFLIEMNKD